MLLLTRNSEESIIIDGGIKITVLEISGSSHVKIGNDAPAEVKVYREEIVERMQAEADGSKDAA